MGVIGPGADCNYLLNHSNMSMIGAHIFMERYSNIPCPVFPKCENDAKEIRPLLFRRKLTSSASAAT